MSAYVGDFRTGKVVRKMWNTNAVAGESITRATNGTISVYKDGGTTQSTTGVTDTEDFDSLTGVHLVAIDTSADGTFYSAGSDFEVVLSAATIDGKSINATLFSFSLENRSALMPTTDGRKLDVSSGGEAGLDWANIGSPTTTVGLSGTTVKTATDVETDTQDIQSRLPAALVSGRMSSDAIAISGSTTAADNVESNIGNLDATVSSRASQTSVNTIDDFVDTEVAAIKAVTDKLNDTLEDDGGTYRFTANALEEAPTGGSAPTVGEIADEVETRALLLHADYDAAKTAATQASINDLPTNAEFTARTLAADDYLTVADLAALALEASVQAVKAKTDNLPASPAAVGSAMTLSAAGLDAIAVESSITAGAGLTNDSGTQLTDINARQALAAMLSSLAAILAGAATTTITTKPAAKPGGNTRITATVDEFGNRSAVQLKVPD